MRQVLLAMLLAALTPVPALAAEHGGTGGNAFTTECPATHAMVGIAGRYGATLDAIRIVCAEIGLDGKRKAALQQQSQYGGTGGGEFTLMCAEDQIAIGITGRSGTLVDALGLTCGKVQISFRAGRLIVPTSGSPIGPAGGSGGNAFTDTCNTLYGDLLHGLRGRSGTLVDAIAPYCLNTQNIHLQYEKYTVTLNAPAGNAFLNTPVQLSWSAAAGPPASLSAAPRFKVEIAEPVAGTGAPPALPTIDWSAVQFPDYSAFKPDTSRTVTFNKTGVWVIRVTAIPFTSGGGALPMFQNQAGAAITVVVQPTQPATPVTTTAPKSLQQIKK